MPFYNELAAAAGSTYIKDVVAEKFKREVTMLRIDELELTKKAQEIKSRVCERELLLEELELFSPFELTQRSMLELNTLQTQDLKETAEIIVAVMKKKARIAQLQSFIEKLKELA